MKWILTISVLWIASTCSVRLHSQDTTRNEVKVGFEVINDGLLMTAFERSIGPKSSVSIALGGLFAYTRAGNSGGYFRAIADYRYYIWFQERHYREGFHLGPFIRYYRFRSPQPTGTQRVLLDYLEPGIQLGFKYYPIKSWRRFSVDANFRFGYILPPENMLVERLNLPSTRFHGGQNGSGSITLGFSF